MRENRIVECVYVCETAEPRLLFDEYPYISTSGELRFNDGTALRRRMPLKPGMTIEPGVYRVVASLGPLFKILAATPMPAARG